MSKPLTRPEPKSVITESWWTKPEMLANRAAFQEKLVDEYIRMNKSRFGGTRRYHDSGLGEKQ